VPILQINQQPSGASHRYRISVSATQIPDRADLSYDTDIQFELSRENSERIRWYLEDYLQFDEDPAPQIAKDVERFMANCGEELFTKIFDASSDAIRLWSSLEPHVSTTRIEIAAGVSEATAIPWELIRDPRSRTFLALAAGAFVRKQRAGQTVLPPVGETAKVRILLVICRPRGGEDVPFRSVAGRLVTRLSDEARNAFDIDVLRPPTYEQLAKTLRLAKDRGEPYHVVHFDGHGVYADPRDLAHAGKVLSSLKLDAGSNGTHGFLMFEDPDSETNGEFVDGFRLGGLLRDTSVPVLVLNACQSAFVEARSKPEPENSADAREEIEAYGSLAQAVMDSGAAGVVAMRYSVYVVTAAQFVAELYGALARGHRLGEAVTWARKNLHDQPDRQVAYEARPLQDWSVPVVWERAPLRLWPEKTGAGPLKISLDEGGASKPGALDEALPSRPDVGFYGRDETLYALDRAFDSHRIVLLHAFAGSGKTSTAAEFARWYALTGGVEGPILFTSFERYLPLSRVLDKVGIVFGNALEEGGIQWDAITDTAQRQRITLQILQQIPVLWIWDNVEQITGFPAGFASDWSIDEQQELRAFLVSARETGAKFLLTSRRQEGAWLGELPRRVGVPAMPMQERLQLAGAIAARRGKRLADLPDLTPLLRFTLGNPLTILVTVGEAIRAGIHTKEQLGTFVSDLRGGEIDFQDENTEGRSKSLGASLSYGFGSAFSDNERKLLALLHLFQGFVEVGALEAMGVPSANWSLDAVRGITREREIVLLDRAAEIGLLTPHGNGFYAIHPAVPWYFKSLFEQYFPESSGCAHQARHAFVGAMSVVGNSYHNEYEKGRRTQNIISIIEAEEENLLAAIRLARAGGWWASVIGAMQGLLTLYDATGRRATWRRQVEDIIPDFIDSQTGGPLPGREEEWMFVTQYQVHLAMYDLKWSEAESLQRMRVDRVRQEVESNSSTASSEASVSELGTVLGLLGDIQRGQGHATCVDALLESLRIAEATKNVKGQAVRSFNLGVAYNTVPDLIDLDKAEHWYRKYLDLLLPDDALGRSKGMGQLGHVAFTRFQRAKAESCPEQEISHHLLEAAQLYEDALDLLKPSDVSNRGITHNQLGIIYSEMGNFDRALHHFQQDIRCCEQTGDLFGAGKTRANVARMLVLAERLNDARTYAEAALNNFRGIPHASDDVGKAERLITRIDNSMNR
jgi:tetratricopeptide (TPR) repeat protein